MLLGRRKKRDGRKADGLGLVPQWDLTASSVIFPSIGGVDEQRQKNHPKNIGVKRRLPQRPATQESAGSKAPTFSRESVAKYHFLPKTPRALANSPRSPRIRPSSRSKQDTSAASHLPVDAVVDTLVAFAQPQDIAETSHAGVLHLFLEDWLERFKTDDINYRSIIIHAEVGFSEIYRLTSHLKTPNDILTAFCCTLLERLVPYFGPYESLLQVLSDEVQRSVYTAVPTRGEPRKLFNETTYFTSVNQITNDVNLRMEKRAKCVARNEFLEKELLRSQASLELALDKWGNELLKAYFYAWYEACVVRKKVIAKNLRWFSTWFSGSPRTLMACIFEDWRRFVLANTSMRISHKLQEDCDKVALAQKHVAKLSETNEALQEEYEHHLESNQLLIDSIQQYASHIEHAKVFLKTSASREEAVCYEGQLRIEATSELTYFILESLLRLQYNLGFHQKVLCHISPDSYCLEQFASCLLDKPQPSDFPTIDDMNADNMLALLTGLNKVCSTRDNFLMFCSINLSDISSPIGIYLDMLNDFKRQQEHYATTSTLFYARHLEEHETSVVPASHPLGNVNGKLRPNESILEHRTSVTSTQIFQTLPLPQADSKPTMEVHWRYLIIGRCFLEYSSLLFHPSDMSPYINNPLITAAIHDAEFGRLNKANLIKESENGNSNEATVDSKSLTRMAANCIVDSFYTWRDICRSLCNASVVQNLPDMFESSFFTSTASPEKRGSKTSKGGMSSANTFRVPKRLHGADHCELHPTSIYSTGGSVASKKYGDFESAKLHSVESAKVMQFNAAINQLHTTLKVNKEKEHEIETMREAVRHTRRSMWHHVCVMVTDKEKKIPQHRTAQATANSEDPRPSLYTAISWDCSSIAALLHEEAEPEVELQQVRQLFLENDSVLRQMYTQYIDGTSHALSLEELLRILKRIGMLCRSILVGKSDEAPEMQLIPVVDLAEIIIRICNEQYAELYTLTRRIERFIKDHLCLLNKSDAILSIIANTAEVKAVLLDSKEVLQGIFKTYTQAHKGKDKSSQYMTIRDWMGFVKDYRLVTPRFSSEEAHILFFRAQEGSIDDDDMEMLFSEFCEAIVALGGYMLTDPFIDWPVKTSLFIKRFLVDKHGKA